MHLTYSINTFRGHVSEGFLLMEPICVLYERPRDRKVSETRLTVLSDQDVVLDALSIGMRVCSIPCFAYRTDAAV